ncbi:MAG: thioredoxin-like domain-containing protein [Limnohabitans sp.]|nr:thioredoxin-like domain-containing protein [Limnohabitans sp.]
MKTFLFSILFLSVSFCNSQNKQVTIIGSLPNLYGGDYISFSKPIGKYSTLPFYTSDTAKIKNNKFVKKIDISDFGMIFIFEKPFNGIASTRFFVEPGDTIRFEKKSDGIIFTGKNSVINKMYSDIKIAPVAFNGEIVNIYTSSKNADEVISKINNLEKKYYQQYSSYFQDKQISKLCLNYTKTVMEHSIDILVLNAATDANMREQLKLNLPKEEADKIALYFNLKYNTYNKNNLQSLFFPGLIKKNALYLESIAIAKKEKGIRFWNQFDDIFKIKSKNFGVIDYSKSNEYQETFVGQILLDLVKSYDKENTIKFKDLVTVYNAFVEKFPNSPYIKPLSESIMNIAVENINFSDKKEVVKTNVKIGDFAIYEKVLNPVDSNPFAQPNQSLSEALAQRFPNQDVFIDFWATWCSPCVKQFDFNKDLHTFLESKNIKTVYVSFDKETELTKWEKYIQDYNLAAYHFLGDKNYQDKYLSTLSNTIPAYFVYNSKTKKLTKIEGLPSEKEKFYDNIANALK